MGVITEGNNSCNWWTRTTNEYSAFVVFVNEDGIIEEDVYSDFVSARGYGVCLAMWVSEEQWHNLNGNKR